MMEHGPDFYTPNELAKILRLGRNKVYELLAEGKIEGLRYGAQWRIPRRAVERLQGREAAQ